VAVANDTLCVGLVPGVDPWILASCWRAFLLPELFGLVGLGNRGQSKAPRGATARYAALGWRLIYVGVRATLHESAVAQLDAQPIEANRRGGWQRLPTRFHC